MFSSWGSVYFFVSQAILDISKRKDSAFTQSENPVFCVFFCSKDIENGVSVDLVNLFDLWIISHFVCLDFICDLEYSFTVKVLTSP